MKNKEIKETIEIIRKEQDFVKIDQEDLKKNQIELVEMKNIFYWRQNQINRLNYRLTQFNGWLVKCNTAVM